MKGLRPHHFPASPFDVPAWEKMSKSELQRSMTEQQWDKLNAERERRRRVVAAARPPPAAAASKRPRLSAFEPRADAPVLIVDCGSYDALMSRGEGASLGNQLMLCYSAVRLRARCVQLILSGLSDDRLEQLQRVSGAESWRAHVTRAPLEALLDDDAAAGAPPPPWTGVGSPDRPPRISAARTTYLTADASAVITRFEPGRAYVIGGLVDRNRHPRVAAERAAALGLDTARFPLLECGAAATASSAAAASRRRRVLTTNKSVELCAAVAEALARRESGPRSVNADEDITTEEENEILRVWRATLDAIFAT
jgi:tRNA (guanine9-N1)-methyltransferase